MGWICSYEFKTSESMRCNLIWNHVDEAYHVGWYVGMVYGWGVALVSWKGLIAYPALETWNVILGDQRSVTEGHVYNLGQKMALDRELLLFCGFCDFVVDLLCWMFASSHQRFFEWCGAEILHEKGGPLEVNANHGRLGDLRPPLCLLFGVSQWW